MKKNLLFEMDLRSEKKKNTFFGDNLIRSLSVIPVFVFTAHSFSLYNIINRLWLLWRRVFFILFFRGRGWRGRVVGGFPALQEADFGTFEDMYAHKTKDE